jgi:peptidyl-tRNA hydrolase, PTH1 family
VTRLILGLGNPGEEYRASRHNAGFRVVEELARRWGVRLGRLECNSLTALVETAATTRAPEAAGGAGGVLLAKPQTYMNRSGFAARCLVELHGLDPAAVLVVYDEINLPFGRLRLRRAGSPAGHRGMESILENLRTDQVPRLRLGIGSPDGAGARAGDGAGEREGDGERLVDFVLSPFAPAEEEGAAEMVRRAADACEVWLSDGIDAAMQRFNTGAAAAGPADAADPGEPA